MKRKRIKSMSIIVLLFIFSLYTIIFPTIFSQESVSAISITNEYPSNGTTEICPPLAELGVNVTHSQGKRMNITFYSNLSCGIWDWFYTGSTYTFSNVTNGSYFINPIFFVTYNYTYYWNVSVNDGTNFTESSIYYFTTAVENCSYKGSDMETIYYTSLVGIIGILGILGFIIKKRKRKQ